MPGLEEGEGEGELVSNGDRVSVWEDEKVLVVMIAQPCDCTSCH